MSPPHNGHRFNSSPSSTGTRPKSSSRNSQNIRNASGTGGGGGTSSQPPKSELERLLREQQAKLRSLEQEQTSHGGAGVVPNPEFQDYHEKLRLLQALNGAPSNSQQENFYESEDIFNLRLQRELQNQWRLLEQKQSHQNAMEEMKMDNVKLKQSLQKQQEQIHQLTQSLNQCFQALLIMQRDMAEQKNVQHCQQRPLEDTMDSVSQQRDFESCPSASWDFDFAPSTSRAGGPAGVAPGLETWNNFFPPHPDQLGNHGESESGVSTNTGSGALNNTVPPGMRANNYWDNFRSFSRQNRLSSNLQSLSPIVAQVTPRQVQPQLHLPHSPFRSNNNGDHHHTLLDNAAIIAPLSFSSISSPSRPRRKQKINREQNVNNERPQPEAAMVFPIRQERQVQPNNPRRQNEVQPMMLNNPVVTSIKRSIYSHVNELIAQNEERPERLARIFQDLQTINRSDQALESANADALANLNVSSSTSGHLQRPSWSMYSAAADVEDEDNNGVTSTSFKSGIKRFTPNDNRLAYLASSSAMHPNADNNSSNSSSLVAEDERLLPTLFSFEESLSSLGAVGGSSGANGDQTEKNKKVNEQNVAVPKNVQRNIISRERDGRKVKREKQPRNMMNQQDHEQDQLEHHPGAALTLTFRNNESESEMIEADQQDNQSFMDLQPLEVGLDRVPTRLSSTELDYRRAEEEDNIQNLVDEVLNTSSDTDFVANDHNLPSPKS